ncbi:acid protease [Pilatotrama ljubarskyi]|nr:acid protease [Pilatotrama ljubarskyi]
MFSTKTVLVLSLCASYALAFTPPARLDIPLLLSPGGRPMMGVGMSSGQVQNFNFTFTTSLGYTAVAGKGCSGCSNTPLYDISLSSSAKSLSGQSAVSLGSGNFQGSVIKEDCKIYIANGSSWAYPNQTVVVSDNQSQASPFEESISGLLGLGTLKKATNAAGFPASFDDGLYGQYYIRNPDATNFTFGLALKRTPVIPGNSSSLTIAPDSKSLADSDVGTVHWLQPDHSAYQADQVQWRSVQDSITSGYLANNTQPDLTVQLDGWTAKLGSNNVAVTDPILVNVDPYFPGIYMPMQQARLIHDAISGSQQTQLSTIPGQTNAWSVPCDTQMQFTVIIGQQRFTVDQSILVVDQGDGQCLSLIEGFTDSSVTQYILGQNFMSQLYVIFNIPKDGTAIVGFAPRTVSSTRSRDIGAIVGGTVGGVAGVVALGLLAFYLIRRRQDNSFFKRAAEIEEEHKVASTVEPYTFGQNMVAHHQVDPFSPHTPGFGSPPATAHAPLLGMHDPAHGVAPPSYEEASESGVASGSRFPRDSKAGYRRDTVMTGMTGGGSPPVSPNETSFSGAGSSAV